MDTRVKTIVLDRDYLPTLDQMDATAIPEKQFEGTATRVLKSLHPTCHVFEFKSLINYGGTGWKGLVVCAGHFRADAGYLRSVCFGRRGYPEFSVPFESGQARGYSQLPPGQERRRSESAATGGS